jgi:hypothetical protein
MSSKRDKDKNVIFVCDACGDEDGGVEDDFALAWASLIDMGWIYTRGDNTHNCGCLTIPAEIPGDDKYGDFR